MVIGAMRNDDGTLAIKLVYHFVNKVICFNMVRAFS
jgi:hypothetical protein